MLNHEDRRAIEGLFDRLADVERRAPERDRDAEALTRDEIERLPNAPYYMAQTIVVQQQALEAAEQRIQDLQAREIESPRRRGPWDRNDEGYDSRQQRGSLGGGGFLAGAMQTALGVAGGVLLGSAIGSLFGAGSAHAADQPGAEDQGEANEADTADQSADADTGGGSDGDWGDFGGGGDFDMGGDF
jgi:hypothetical protein